jgi:HSP20 family protein
MKIIVRVRELRKTHNLTQEELARQLKISRQSLISLEQGRWLPSLPLAIQLAEFFNAPLEQVIYTEAPQPHVQKIDQPRKEMLMPHDPNTWPPFPELRQMKEEMDRLAFGQANTFPTVNIRQDEHHIYVEAHVPGYTDEQIDIDVADEYVTISGNAVVEKNVDEAGYIRREFQQQSFSRTVGLPVAVVSDKAQAKLANGVLTITLPKITEEKPKTKRLKPTSE